MNLTHLKRNTFLLLFAIITLSFGVFLYIFYQFQFERLQNTKDQYYAKIQNSFNKNVDLHLKEHYTAVALNFLNDEIIKAVAQKDRQTLIKLTLEKYTQLKTGDKYVEVMHFHQNDGISLLRLHNLSKYGDNVSKQSQLVADLHSFHKPIASFDLRPRGFAYRVIIPLFYQNTYVGAFEIGVNPKKILDLVTHFNNIQGVLRFRENQTITQYEQVTEKKVLQLLPKYPMLLPYSEIRNKNKYYAVYTFYIHPYTESSDGEFVFFEDLTKETLAFYKATQNMIIAFFILIAMLYIVLNIVFNRYSNVISHIGKRTKAILDTQNNFVFVSTGKKLIEANKAFLIFIGFQDLESFLHKYNCICDLFVKEEGYLQAQMGDMTWTEYILAYPDLTHLVKIEKEFKEYIFKVFANNFNNNVVLTMQDITQELQKEKKLLKSELSLKKAQIFAHIGNWEFNLIDNQLIWSDEIFRIFEIDQNEFDASYEAFLNLIHPDDREMVNKVYTNSLRTKQKYEISHRLLMPDGRIKYVYEQCDTTFDQNNQPLISFGIVQDITENIKNQQLLQEKDHLIQQQSHLAALGEMIGNIAHQWRQPLGAISAITSLIIVKKELNIKIEHEELVSQMTSINDQVQYLSKTIDDFRDYLKEDQNKAIFKISDMLNDSVKIAKAGYENSHITITTDFNNDITYFGFKNILSQVILILLSNARDALLQNEIKNKKVFLSLHELENMIIITVKDNGGGVPDGIKNKIFDPYFTTKHKGQGTGLGLYMSNQIIQKHFNGHISISNIEDQDGTGACFTVAFSII